MHWDDLRHVLAIARGGTLSAAARELGVNQTTVSRRLERLERTLGTRLFDRQAGGLSPTADGQAVLARLARMEEEALAVPHVLKDGDGAPAGPVRFTTLQALITGLIAPRLATFLARHPAIAVELVGSATNLNLSRREADLAIRLSRPQSGAFLARKVGEVGYAVYGARDRFAAADAGSLAALPWFAYDESWAHLPEAAWLRETVRPSRIVATGTDILTLAELAKGGDGVAVLPCMLGDAAPALCRLAGDAPVLSREMWLLSHPENKGVKRIDAFTDWLIETIRAERPRLAGEPG